MAEINKHNIEIPTTNAALEYLLGFLQDEFRDAPAVRIRRRQRSTTKRSPDLFQDYDPEANTLHTAQGVEVRIRSRDYFFPLEWSQGTNRKLLEAQIEEIREFLDSLKSR